MSVTTDGTGIIEKHGKIDKTWTKRTILIVIVVAITYGVWFNLIDSLAHCLPSSNNTTFDHTCTSIGTIFGGNGVYQLWNIVGHFLPGLFMALLFKKNKLELFIAGVLISTLVMDSPLWGIERKVVHGLPLWMGNTTSDGNHTHITEWHIEKWVKYYYNPEGFYLVWDHYWLFPGFPNAATIFWSIVGRAGAAFLLIWYFYKIESKNQESSLKRIITGK
jgi:hypothetical protein